MCFGYAFGVENFGCALGVESFGCALGLENFGCALGALWVWRNFGGIERNVYLNEGFWAKRGDGCLPK